MMEKGGNQKKVGIGILDIVIILLIIAAVAAVILRYTTDYIHFGDNKTDCIVGFAVTGVRYTTYDMIDPGDIIYFEDGSVFGTLGTCSATPAVFYVTEDDGSVIEAHYPENSLIDLSCTASGGLIDRGGRFVTGNGTHISAGVRMTLHTRTVDLEVLITSVEPVQQ